MNRYYPRESICTRRHWLVGTVLPGLALAASCSLASTLAAAEEAPRAASVSQIGKQIRPTAHAYNVVPHLRTPSDMAAWAASMKNLPARQPQAGLAPRPTMGEDAYRAAKAAADAMRGSFAKPPRDLSGIGPLVAPTSITINKPGPSAATAGDGFYPPDTTGAIGTTQIAFPVNQTMNVYTRAGALLKSTAFGAFFGTSDALSDPRVVYDPLWNRWVVTDTVVPTSTDSACFWVAVSTGSDATGSYYAYRPCISGGIFAAGDLWDYDMLGESQDSVLVTGNIFGTTAFKGPAVIAFPKALIYNGQGFSVPAYALGTSVGTVAPPIVQDSNADAYFLAVSSDLSVLDLYRGTNLSNEYQFSFTLQAQLSSGFSVPPSAPQPGTTQVLDTLDGRFEQALTQVGSSLWAVHTVNLGGYPTPYYAQINTGTSAFTQAGYFYESGTSNDFNPSIAANANGDAFVTWSSTDASATSSAHNAYVRFSGRQAGDALGVIGAGTQLINSGAALTGDYQNGIQRWGDYSAVSMDPVAASCGAGQRAAVFNERINNANTWGTRFGLIGFCR